MLQRSFNTLNTSIKIVEGIFKGSAKSVHATKFADHNHKYSYSFFSYEYDYYNICYLFELILLNKRTPIHSWFHKELLI